jgi:flagellar protein FliS
MTDDFRTRYLRDRVLTASPAQRVVMLYDRLSLDLTRAADPDGLAAVDHAVQIVTELLASLDQGAGGPAENLAALYGYLIRELLAVRSGERERLTGAAEIVETLRSAWTAVAAGAAPSAAPATPAAAGAWVG